MKSISGTKTVFFVLFFIAGLTYSCQDDESSGETGKVDPGSVAGTNLIAYFPFDREPAGGAAVANSNSQVKFVRKIGEGSFVPGRRGKAYQGSTIQSCLEYDVVQGSAFTTINEFTLTCWLNSNVTSTGIAMIFGLNGGDTLMGNLSLLQESRAQGDSVDLVFYLFDNYSAEPKSSEVRTGIDSLKGSWFHLVALYRKSTSTMELFANGNMIFSQESYTGNVGILPLLGDTITGRGISKIYFGAWPQQLAGTPEGWMTYYSGLIDEFRIYNKALSEEEVTDLYEAELSQAEE